MDRKGLRPGYLANVALGTLSRFLSGPRHPAAPAGEIHLRVMQRFSFYIWPPIGVTAAGSGNLGLWNAICRGGRRILRKTRRLIQRDMGTLSKLQDRTMNLPGLCLGFNGRRRSGDGRSPGVIALRRPEGTGPRKILAPQGCRSPPIGAQRKWPCWTGGPGCFLGAAKGVYDETCQRRNHKVVRLIPGAAGTEPPGYDGVSGRPDTVMPNRFKSRFGSAPGQVSARCWRIYLSWRTIHRNWIAPRDQIPATPVTVPESSLQPRARKQVRQGL